MAPTFLDELYHTSLSSRYVRGGALFHELPHKERKSITRLVCFGWLVG